MPRQARKMTAALAHAWAVAHSIGGLALRELIG